MPGTAYIRIEPNSSAAFPGKVRRTTRKAINMPSTPEIGVDTTAIINVSVTEPSPTENT